MSTQMKLLSTKKHVDKLVVYFIKNTSIRYSKICNLWSHLYLEPKILNSDAAKTVAAEGLVVWEDSDSLDVADWS